jgi:ubiquinone/menaquinone biosynthesis C-methylase UbiE
MDRRAPNSQYNLAAPESLSVRVATTMRRHMFDMFMQALAPDPAESVLDLGVTSDQTYSSSNYFEALYPHKYRITAAGLDDAQFLEEQYPGLRFVHANALDIPFGDGAFDLVHSSAVLEHVGSFDNQARMVAECLRVARRGVFLTTPNRWFPIEFHTQLPLVHWLPKPVCRAVFRRTGYDFFAEEANLNLMTPRELRRIGARHPGWSLQCRTVSLVGWPSNLLMIGTRVH